MARDEESAYGKNMSRTAHLPPRVSSGDEGEGRTQDGTDKPQAVSEVSGAKQQEPRDVHFSWIAAPAQL